MRQEGGKGRSNFGCANKRWQRRDDTRAYNCEPTKGRERRTATMAFHNEPMRGVHAQQARQALA
eukprot:3274657-Prymnesium_polylepis.1